MSTLQIFLFGRLHIQIGKSAATGLESRKVQELLCYLLLFRDRQHPRESLADLLWADRSGVHSKKYLRQALWQLQTIMEGQATSASECRLVATDGEWIRLNPEAEFWLDVAEFEQSFRQAHGVRGRELQDSVVQSLKRAAALYRGDLLEDCYEDWCIFERERLQNMYLTMLEKLIDHCEAHGAYEEGVEFGTCILRSDRARERTHRQLMRLHILAGNRSEALRQYQRCTDALAEELDVKPGSSTVALYQRIKNDWHGGHSASMFPPSGKAKHDRQVLFAILNRLRRLQVLLAAVNGQVCQDISTVEEAINDLS